MTARSASAFARKNRVRELGVAPDRAEEEEALGPGGLGVAQQPGRRDAVELLDAARRLVADGRRQVDHLARAAHELPQRRRVGQVAQRDLDPHPIRPQPPRIAHQDPHGLALRRAAASAGPIPTTPVAPVSTITGHRLESCECLIVRASC